MSLSPVHILACFQSFLSAMRQEAHGGQHAFMHPGDLLHLSLRDLPCSFDRQRAAMHALATFLDIPEHAHTRYLDSVTPSTTLASLARRLASMRDGKAGFLLKSSGTTGQRKQVRHTKEFFLQEILFIRERFAVQNIVSAVPLHHTYGFTFGVMLAEHTGCLCEQIWPFPELIRQRLRNRTLFLGVPFIFEKILPLLQERSAEVVFCSAGSALPASLARTHPACGDRFLDIYGSSENGAMGVRTVHEPLFTLQKHFSREDDLLQRRFPDGQRRAVSQDDELRWHDERHFEVLGRLDKAIQIAGVNIYPRHIEQKIAEHPFVKACSVRLDQSHRKGRLKVFIVPEGEYPEQILKKALHKFYAANLLPEERPVRMTVGTELPRNAMGKPGDWE